MDTSQNKLLGFLIPHTVSEKLKLMTELQVNDSFCNLLIIGGGLKHVMGPLMGPDVACQF